MRIDVAAGQAEQKQSFCIAADDAGECLFGERHMPTSEEVLQKVQETLVDALGVDDDEVTLEATLIGDLGAESIDFLDIVFRLEKNFDIRIPRGDLFPENLAADPASF